MLLFGNWNQLTDLILSSAVAVDQNENSRWKYLQQERENIVFSIYQKWVCQVSRVKCSVYSQSDRLPFIISSQASSPAKPNIFIDSAIFLCQLHTALSLRIQYIVEIRKGMKWRETLSWILSPSHLFISALLPHLSWVSDFSRDSSSFTLALPQQLSGWFHSDATKTPHTVFFVISCCFLSKSKTPSLTSTPTHLQNKYQLQLRSDFSRSTLSPLHPDWCQHWLCSDMVMSRLWPWLHVDSKMAVHQLWLWLISSCKP